MNLLKTLYLINIVSLYLLIDGGKKDKKEFTFHDFFPFESIIELAVDKDHDREA